MANVSPARGMRDFDQLETQRRTAALRVIGDVYTRFGYREIETPILEELSRLLSSDGGDNEKMIFKVMRRGLSSEELGRAESEDDLADLGLRFDLTLPLARFYATHRAKLPRVWRCIQIGPVWRAERPQRGRFRQFTQCDIDVIGQPSYLAEVELIVATVAALTELGMSELTVRVNDRGLLFAMLEACDVPDEYRRASLIVIDKLDKIGFDGVETELGVLVGTTPARRIVDVLRTRDASGDSAVGFAQALRSDEALASAEGIDAILAAARAGLAGDAAAIRFDPTVIRGMGYYTGPIFEIAHPTFRGAVAGGGRYDGMIGRFLGEDVAATGFSIGFERIMELVPQGFGGDRRPSIALVYEATTPWPLIAAKQRELVLDGFTVQLLERSKRLGRDLQSLAEDGFAEMVQLDASGNVTTRRSLTRGAEGH